MKQYRKFPWYVVFVGLIGLTSCGNGQLSKSSAKKQIEAFENSGRLTKIALKKNMYFQEAGWGITKDQAENRVRLWKNGRDFAELSMEEGIGYPHLLDFKITYKGKPFLTTEGDESLLQFGTVQTEIVSITEPAPDRDGRQVCKVRYSETLQQNDLGKEIGAQLDRNGEKEFEITFVKMQDGWQIDKDH